MFTPPHNLSIILKKLLILIAAIFCLLLFLLLFIPDVNKTNPEPNMKTTLVVYESQTSIPPKLDFSTPAPTSTPTINNEPKQSAHPTSPYASLNLNEEDIILAAQVVWAEARGEEYRGQVAVAEVIFNRVLHPSIPGDTVREVVLAPNQFAVGETYTEQQVQAVLDAINGYGALDGNTDVVYFSTGDLRYGSYYTTIGGHVFRTYF